MSSINVMIIGLLVSFTLFELLKIYPGGIIVPGYLALYVHYPVRLAMTIAIAIITMYIYRLVILRAFLFGFRRFVFMILTGAFLSVCITLLVPGAFPISIDYRIVGIMIPGLIANNSEKQGIIKTISLTAIATVLTFLISQLFLFPNIYPVNGF